MVPGGILNLLKPPGMTSHDAVAAVRRLFGERRVGHIGTLDPDAAGVLVVCIGQATKAIQFMTDDDKEYYAVAVLGMSTDTLDAGGAVVGRAVPGWFTTETALREAVAGLTGPIEQLPPMVSAVHHQGKRLYELARAGLEVERQSRRVLIHQLDYDQLSGMGDTAHLTAGTSFRLFIRCSKGTYIRTLVDDLGRTLGGGAYLEFLVRSTSGAFHIRDSVTFEELEGRSVVERCALLLRPEEGLKHLRPVQLDAEGETFFRTGRQVAQGGESSAASAGRAEEGGETVRVFGPAGRFLGVGQWRDAILRPVRVF